MEASWMSIDRWMDKEVVVHIHNGLLLLLLSRFSCVWLCATPTDGSPLGSPIPGILQARTPEWVAISSSNAWKWKVKVKSLSRVQLLATPRTAAFQAPPPMGFSRHYSAIKRNVFESVLMRWMNLEPIIQTEVSHKEKHKYRILTHIYGT